MSREQLSEIISGLDDRHIVEAIRYSPGDAASPERIEHMKRKRIFTIAFAAALILALGAAAYAISGIPRATGTHNMPKVAEYTSLTKLPKIEKNVGYPVIAPERFTNGYTFARLRVDGQAVFGEDNEVLKEYYAVRVIYTKPDLSDIILNLDPVMELEGGNQAPEPSEWRTINDVPVGLSLDHYKVVPEDYVKTEDDLAKEAAGHYYISFGSDIIEEHDVAFANFKLDGVIYTLMDMSAEDDSFDILSQMAKEIIEAEKG